MFVARVLVRVRTPCYMFLLLSLIVFAVLVRVLVIVTVSCYCTCFCSCSCICSWFGVRLSCFVCFAIRGSLFVGRRPFFVFFVRVIVLVVWHCSRDCICSCSVLLFV